ncbi:MAG TPA: type II toxin-antitoxin system RelE/ParE family toxin [Candidatus Babeliales bacterium]|nr:type II toxin-antitoxin system RelE/ParE family toxin [Candidatus Babeliales bacterium]
MGKWILKYWEDVSGKKVLEKWLLKLSKDQFIAISKELSFLELNGKDLKLPHSRSLGKGLFELRDRRYGIRVYYGFYKDMIIILLHAGDKDTQEGDIKLARKRLAIILRGK